MDLVGNILDNRIEENELHVLRVLCRDGSIIQGIGSCSTGISGTSVDSQCNYFDVIVTIVFVL